MSSDDLGKSIWEGIPESLKKHRADWKGVEITKAGVNLKFIRAGYFIARDRIDTYEKLLNWVLHLTEKTWMNNSRIAVFITKVTGVYFPDFRQGV